MNKKKMNTCERLVFEDLTILLEWMAKKEEMENKRLFSDEVVRHISYAMEHLSGDYGYTDEIFLKEVIPAENKN